MLWKYLGEVKTYIGVDHVVQNDENLLNFASHIALDRAE